MADINILKERDIYNLLLFAIFKLTDDPNYSVISELIYTLDKDTFLKFCATFGGCTIKVPTLLELKLFTCALILYQEIDINHKTFTEAYNLTQMDQSYKKDIFDIYKKIGKVVESYGK